MAVCGSGVGGAAAKGEGLTAIAAGYGSVWVGTGTGAVLALPRSLDRTERVIAASPTGYVHGLTARYGGVWVLGNMVARITAAGNVRTVPGTASATTFAIAAGAGSVWVADDGADEIVRIDPHRVTVEARVRVPGRAVGIAAGPGRVIVVSVPTDAAVTGPRGVRLLHRLDPETNRLSRPLVRLGCDVGIVVGSRAVWTFDACSGDLARRDPRTLRVERQARTGVLSQVPALGFGSVWLATRGGTLRVDPGTLRRTLIPARSTSVAVGSGYVWALDGGYGGRPPTLRKIDPRTNRVVGVTTIAIER